PYTTLFRSREPPAGRARRRCRLPPPGAAPRASPLVRPTRCGEENDLAVAREVQPQALLRARHQHGATLRGSDAALQVGAVRLEGGALGAQLGELARGADRGRLPRVHDPGGDEECHQPGGYPVAAFSHRPPPRTPVIAPSGRVDWRPARPPRERSPCA